jgi:hypothetical protein
MRLLSRSVIVAIMLSGLIGRSLAQEAAGVTQEWKERNLVPYDAYERVLGPPGRDMARLKLPFPMKLAWQKERLVTTITVHRKALPYFEKAFTLLQERKLAQEASIFGGSFNMRKLRGSDRWNAHAWGVEIDIDPDNNQFSWGPERFKMDRHVVEVFEEAGFYWRGRLGFDAMSFSLSYESLKEIARNEGISLD